MRCFIKLRYFLFASVLIFSHIKGYATTLDDVKAHNPTSDKTWAEQWFYNIAVPDVGYFKVSFQTYIAPNFSDPIPKAYIHLAFTPINGESVKYDLFLDEVILTHPDDPGKFYYEVPGVLVADDEAIWVNHENFNFSMRWNGEHHHYWHGLNPGQTPFGIIPEIPGVGGRWFLYTVGTPIQYSFHDGTQSLMGVGYAQLDKGWYDKESSAGMAYSMGLSDKLYYMFTGAKLGNSDFEMWAGRYISDEHDLIFYPAFNNLSVKRVIDSCSGFMRIELNKIRYKLVVEAKADINSFYPLEFPSVIIFGGEQRYMKSMQANVNFSLYKKGDLVETVTMPQALLEFSGPLACDDFFE
ncbi:hypothetical protein Misp06_01348 [Microbulbifer sp. NBRC 101763]|uniref:hypothetical protein n=1 Tax=Microbulbifer TaxID=48073 RepID=UPI0003762474|nr:hypothetical protein [Microbulbifer variabilis]